MKKMTHSTIYSSDSWKKMQLEGSGLRTGTYAAWLDPTTPHWKVINISENDREDLDRLHALNTHNRVLLIPQQYTNILLEVIDSPEQLILHQEV